MLIRNDTIQFCVARSVYQRDRRKSTKTCIWTITLCENDTPQIEQYPSVRTICPGEGCRGHPKKQKCRCGNSSVAAAFFGRTAKKPWNQGLSGKKKRYRVLIEYPGGEFTCPLGGFKFQRGFKVNDRDYMHYWLFAKNGIMLSVESESLRGVERNLFRCNIDLAGA